MAFSQLSNVWPSHSRARAARHGASGGTVAAISFSAEITVARSSRMVGSSGAEPVGSVSLNVLRWPSATYTFSPSLKVLKRPMPSVSASLITWSWVGPTNVPPRSDSMPLPSSRFHTRPPTRSRPSSTQTDRPSRTSSRAAVSPAKPAPTIATSTVRVPRPRLRFFFRFAASASSTPGRAAAAAVAPAATPVPRKRRRLSGASLTVLHSPLAGSVVRQFAGRRGAAPCPRPAGPGPRRGPGGRPRAAGRRRPGRRRGRRWPPPRCRRSIPRPTRIRRTPSARMALLARSAACSSSLNCRPSHSAR